MSGKHRAKSARETQKRPDRSQWFWLTAQALLAIVRVVPWLFSQISRHA